MVALSRASLGAGRLQFLNPPKGIQVQCLKSKVQGPSQVQRLKSNVQRLTPDEEALSRAQHRKSSRERREARDPYPPLQDDGAAATTSEPETLNFEPSPDFGPETLDLRLVAVDGRWRRVEAVLERWRIDDEWWRSQPVSRLYYMVLLEGGKRLEIFQDLTDGQWYGQQ